MTAFKRLPNRTTIRYILLLSLTLISKVVSQTLQYRYLGKSSLLVGTLISTGKIYANRHHSDKQRILGIQHRYSNTLAVRSVNGKIC